MNQRSGIGWLAGFVVLAGLAFVVASCPGNGDDDDDTGGQHMVEDATCAISLPQDTITEGEDAVIDVRIDSGCAGVNSSLEATYSVSGTTVEVDGVWEYDAVDDDGDCCGELQTLTVTGLLAGTYTVEALCFTSGSADCADDGQGTGTWVQTATLTVNAP